MFKPNPCHLCAQISPDSLNLLIIMGMIKSVNSLQIYVEKHS